ncbi:aspartate aminotransferase family protein [Geopsychrobacter electrodiphilus]|uniref:aminotransferase family protein n=1 Tax=Geopsychrobacter electrodiphilus TaxID=225196 RepID=UPI000367F365|nr:aspartate aminotransferase family protein [Geopsychrobacter electrodiphilus]
MQPASDGYLFYQNRKTLPIIDRAEGIYMWDTKGKQYLDGCSGAVVANLGYGNKRIEQAINRQAQKTFFAYRTQFESEPALQLAAKLVEVSAPHLNKVFYVSGGSEAMEAAIKLCRQYFYAKGEGSRHLFISRTPSYHGSTLGVLGLTAYSPLENPFRPITKAHPKIPAPYCYRCRYGLSRPSCGLACAWELERVIQEQGPENVAAFVAEPIGGASTGALVPPEEYFGIIQQICKKYGVMLILDEVMTGFGRTGKLFAYEHWGVEADIVGLSKGMGAGYYPLGAIMARHEITDLVLDSGGFQHGHTYAGNPMGCAIGLEALQIIEDEQLVERSAQMGAKLKAGLERLAAVHAIIGEVRGRGLLLALELVQDRETRRPFPPATEAHNLLTDEASEEGLVIYPRRPINGLRGDHVLIAPPLIITAEEVDELLQRLDRALGRATRRLLTSN